MKDLSRYSSGKGGTVKEMSKRRRQEEYEVPATGPCGNSMCGKEELPEDLNGLLVNYRRRKTTIRRRLLNGLPFAAAFLAGALLFGSPSSYPAGFKHVLTVVGSAGREVLQAIFGAEEPEPPPPPFEFEVKNGSF